VGSQGDLTARRDAVGVGRVEVLDRQADHEAEPTRAALDRSFVLGVRERHADEGVGERSSLTAGALDPICTRHRPAALIALR
jgi:hypothetical protein